MNLPIEASPQYEGYEEVAFNTWLGLPEEKLKVLEFGLGI
jgi:hypothetical protein